MKKKRKKKIEFSEEVIERGQEWRQRLSDLYSDLDEDEELRSYLATNDICVRCGSFQYEEVIDQDQEGLVWCCSDCPEEEQLH
jgi:hypothetical protein